LVILPNTHSIADQFAANGYFVIIPDLFNGNPVPLNPPEGFDLMEWINTEMPKVPAVDPIVEATIKEMRGPLGCKRIGGVGYCFGGKYVCRFLKEGRLDAGYTAHPSFVDAKEVEGIKGPLSIAAAGMYHSLSSLYLNSFPRKQYPSHLHVPQAITKTDNAQNRNRPNLPGPQTPRNRRHSRKTLGPLPTQPLLRR
jgi:dienelactone hydrolase